MLRRRCGGMDGGGGAAGVVPRCWVARGRGWRAAGEVSVRGTFDFCSTYKLVTKATPYKAALPYTSYASYVFRELRPRCPLRHRCTKIQFVWLFVFSKQFSSSTRNEGAYSDCVTAPAQRSTVCVAHRRTRMAPLGARVSHLPLPPYSVHNGFLCFGFTCLRRGKPTHPHLHPVAVLWRDALPHPLPLVGERGGVDAGGGEPKLQRRVLRRRQPVLAGGV